MTEFHKSTFGGRFVAAGEFLPGNLMARADSDMRAVVEAWTDLGARPIESLLPRDVRRQPDLEAAARALLARADREGELAQNVETEDLAVSTPDGDMAIRLYRPQQAGDGPLPVILYFHDGGFVAGGIEQSQAVPRALARRTGAIVAVPAYRLAPEHHFPAAHDDSYAAWLWLVEEARSLGGDPARLALIGEGAGGNLAINVALQAHAERSIKPVHQVLIHPIASNDLTSPSYIENLRAAPVGTPTMQYFFRHAFASRADAADPRIALLGRKDFKGLPPTTLVLAEIDPLRGEGEALAERLHEQGVSVDLRIYEGVTQGFFGLGALVNKAMFAQSQVAGNLLEAFAAKSRKI